MSEYDIYLNGTGYMLAKDSQGRLVSGAHREQIVDPFTRHLSMDEPYTRVPFRFGDGAGVSEYDGSNRYEWGNCVDSRSGRLIPAPEKIDAAEPSFDRRICKGSQMYDTEINNTTGDEGIGQRFTVPSTATTVRSVAVLLKRRTDVNYELASSFTVEIWSDTTGPKPNAQLATKSVSIVREADPFWPFVDRWRNGQYFWVEVVFASDVVIGASTPFWVVVINNQQYTLFWGNDHYGSQDHYVATYDGAAWANGSQTYPMMIKLGYKNGSNLQIDSFPRCFQLYAGIDKVERMYCGTGYRILTNDPAYTGSSWTESKTVGTPVTQLLEFDEKLFAACGPSTDFWYTDGTTGTTVWTQVSGQQSNAFAVHDNMLWKADEASVNGSSDGTTWTGAAVVVGDPGTVIGAMVSHGGKLYAAKPEGIYEINYPDTYPGSGTPTSNLMLDFTSERYPRTWLLDWHSGLYFPGVGGVYELKFNVLRNLWADKVDEGALDTSSGTAPFTRPRSWAPLYDKGPVAWSAAYGTTRGVLFGRSNAHGETCDVIWYDGNNWYSLRATGDVNSADGGPWDYGEYATACFVQDAGGGRGWMWFNEGFCLTKTEWPTWTEDTIDDGTVEYEQHSQATTPWFSLPEKSKEFVLCKVGALSRNIVNQVNYVEVYYRVDDETSWTYLSVFNDSPYQELSFPAATTARRVQFLLEFDTGSASSTTPPIIEQMDLFYQTLPERTKTHQLIISCVGDESLREAGVDERTAGEILADLRALFGSAGFTYIDVLGGSHTVRATALTGQTMNLLTGPGPESVGASAQVILNLLEF